MSVQQSLATLLADMGFAQLALLFLLVGAYLLAINASYGEKLRSGAASVAFVSAIAFAAVTPSWMSGVAFLALMVVAVAAFAAAAWAMSAVLGLGTGGAGAAVGEERIVAPLALPQPTPARARVASLRPL